MQYCAVVFCERARVWLWQPAGPSDDLLCFMWPGSHYRGFAAIPVCNEHKQALTRGISKVVTYHGQNYVYTPEK
jgi:hypothetical protein